METMVVQGLNGWTAAFAAWGLVITILQVLALRHANRVDKLADKLDSLEVTMGSMVTRDELKDHQEQMRLERRDMHNDNKTTIKELAAEFKVSADLDRDERGKMQAKVGEMAMQVAVLADRVERSYRNERT